MAYSNRETLGGLEHLRLAVCRRLFHMKADAYMNRYAKNKVPVEVCLDTSSNPIHCELCGFVVMRAGFDNGWQMEMCSAMPIVDINKPAFRDWLKSLSKDASDCKLSDLKPILHD